jgi:hypothetical protein
VLGFFICWFPYHSQRVITANLTMDALTKSEFMMKLLEYLYYISGIKFSNPSALIIFI